jgi:hypothetical protein
MRFMWLSREEMLNAKFVAMRWRKELAPPWHASDSHNAAMQEKGLRRPVGSSGCERKRIWRGQEVVGIHSRAPTQHAGEQVARHPA